MLNKAGLVAVHPGIAGARLSRDAAEINLLVIYKAVSGIGHDELFTVYETPCPDCPVGRNIHASILPLFSSAQKAMEEVLSKVTLKEVAFDISSMEKSN